MAKNESRDTYGFFAEDVINRIHFTEIWLSFTIKHFTFQAWR